MTHLQLTDVESTNLHLLHAIRLGLERDRVDSCCRFALSAGVRPTCGIADKSIFSNTLTTDSRPAIPLLSAARRRVTLPLKSTAKISAAEQEMARRHTEIGAPKRSEAGGHGEK